MSIMKIEGAGGNSEIHLDASLSQLEHLKAGRKTVVITDENVFAHHKGAFPSCDKVIVVTPGEQSKTMEKVADIHRDLVALEMDRGSLVIGIGGGVVTDLSGFVASTFLRGIAFGFASTTILGQVDAAIGGKNGVNLDGYKNLVGIIRQPEFVLNDTTTLDTLPREEKVNGMAEVIKSGLIADLPLFEMLEAAAGSGAPFDNVDMGHALSAAAAVKVGIVNRDVFENGERKHLNLGHTLGHAIEKMVKMPHGFAVGIGMMAAANISVERGMLTPQEARRIKDTIEGWGLPVATDIQLDDAMDGIRKDKKRKSDEIHFVLPRGLGQVEVQPIPLLELRSVLKGGVL